MRLPARDSDFIFHPVSLAWIFENKPSQFSFLNLLCTKGTPRYLPRSVVVGMSGDVLLEWLAGVGREEDRGFLVIDSLVGLATEMIKALLHYSCLPFHFPDKISSSIMWLSRSMQSTNINGEIGSPCLMPLLGLNHSKSHCQSRRWNTGNNISNPLLIKACFHTAWSRRRR